MITNYKTAVKNIRNILKKYIVDNNLQSLIIGISGGIDSTICAALAKPICDELNIPLIGRSITIETNKKDEINRAREIGKYFCTEFKELDLTDDYNGLIKSIAKDEPSILLNTIEAKIRKGNVKARMRMIRLYDLSGAHKGMVLSTDNYTEYLCGFWTICGDVGDFSGLQYMWKTEVYKMAKYIATNEINKKTPDYKRRYMAIVNCINANPTDGLGITNSDLDQLGVKSYEEADKILQKYLSLKEKLTDYNQLKKMENHVLIKRYNNTHFKRNHPYEIKRECII